MNKIVKSCMVGLALAAMTGTALAAGPGPGWGKSGDCPAWGNRINLTPEQQTKMSGLREKHWKETISLRNELQTKRLELRTLWTAPNPDREKILAKQKELNALRDQMQAKATDNRLEARKVLTPEQAAQMGTFSGGMGRQKWFRGQGPCSGPGSDWGRGQGRGLGPCGSGS